jgi:hypothetical protein
VSTSISKPKKFFTTAAYTSYFCVAATHRILNFTAKGLANFFNMPLRNSSPAVAIPHSFLLKIRLSESRLSVKMIETILGWR